MNDLILSQIESRIEKIEIDDRYFIEVDDLNKFWIELFSFLRNKGQDYGIIEWKRYQDINNNCYVIKFKYKEEEEVWKEVLKI